MKKCDIGNHEVDKLWYARTRSLPSCCGNHECKRKYNEQKEKKLGKGTGTGKTESRSFSGKVGRKAIAPFSKKKIEELKEYRGLRDQYLKDNPACEVCESPKNLTLHHKKTRQYHLCDVSVFMTVCFNCHEKIHREDKWARDNGYLINSR